MHTIFWHAWPHILAQLVQIKDIDVSIVAEGQPSQDHDIFAHACKHAHVQEHFFLPVEAHISTKLCPFREIEVAILAIQGWVSMIKMSMGSEGHNGTLWAHNAHYVLACTGQYFSQIGSYQIY